MGDHDLDSRLHLHQVQAGNDLVSGGQPGSDLGEVPITKTRLHVPPDEHFSLVHYEHIVTGQERGGGDPDNVLAHLEDDLDVGRGSR